MFSKVRSGKLEVRSEKMGDALRQAQDDSWETGVTRGNFKLNAVLFGICFLFFGISSYAQCAMCRAALTSEGNAVKAQAVNDGIVYLMVIPYILVALIGYAVYRMYSKRKN